MTVPKDPAEAVKRAQKEAERFRRDILAKADQKVGSSRPRARPLQGCVTEWCKKFNKVQARAMSARSRGFLPR